MTRWTRALVVISILGTAGATTALGRSERAKDGLRGQRLERLIAELDLDSAQRTQVEAIEDRKVRAHIELQARERLARHELRRALDAEAPDRARIFSIVDELGLIRTEEKKLLLAARLDQRELLTPAQRTQLDSLKEERRMERKAKRAKRGEGLGGKSRNGAGDGAGGDRPEAD